MPKLLAGTKYEGSKKFDIEFKKRQAETREEIVAWSLSKDFQEKVRAETLAVLNVHDELTSLSKRLFQNECFSTQTKEIIHKEIENSTVNRWWKRWTTWALVAGTALLTAAAERTILLISSFFS